MRNSTSISTPYKGSSVPCPSAATLGFRNSGLVSATSSRSGKYCNICQHHRCHCKTIADNKFNLASKVFHDERTVDHALIERLYEILGQYVKDVRNEAKGIRNITFIQVYKLATDKWVYSTPKQCNANLDGTSSMTWHPTEGFKTLIHRTKAAIVYSITIGQQIPDEIIVDKVLKKDSSVTSICHFL